MQESFENTMHVYECPLGHRRYWIKDEPEAMKKCRARCVTAAASMWTRSRSTHSTSSHRNGCRFKGD